MSDHTHAGAMPPPGWIFDPETGRTRWWDGVRWTDLVKPLDPVVRTGPSYTPVSAANAVVFGTPPSGNATAGAALTFAVIGGLGLAIGTWLTASLGATVTTVLSSATVAVIVTAFILSIVATVIAIRRPTRKGAAITALIVSSLLLSAVAFRILVVLLP